MKFFDLDGTLIDSNGVWVQLDLDFLASRGLTITQEYTEFVTHNTYDQAAAYTKEYYALPDSVDEIMREWGEMVYAAYSRTIPLKEGVLDYLLRQKQAGEQLGVITSCMDHLCHAVLERTGVLPLLTSITTVKEVARDKKFPDIYLLAAEKSGLSPADCIMFEDSPTAIHGAKDAGFSVIGVYDPFFADREDEMRQHCDRYIHSFTDL